MAGCPVLLVIVLISMCNIGLTSRRSCASFVLSQCNRENSDLAEGLSDDEMDTILSQMDLTVLISPPSMLSASTSFFYKMIEFFLDVIRRRLQAWFANDN